MSALASGHKAVADRDDKSDIERMIDNSGCAKEYYSLEECMGENDRKWAKCREQIAALKQCNTKKHPSGGVDVLPK